MNASIDRWHLPRAVRFRRGGESPEGYYRDSFDYVALKDRLLVPFRQGMITVSAGCYDYLSDLPDEEYERVGPTSALLFDGVFLQRSALRHFWDLTVYLHVPEAVTLARAIARDGNSVGEQVLTRRYQRRYLPAKRYTERMRLRMKPRTLSLTTATQQTRPLCAGSPVFSTGNVSAVSRFPAQ
jgi:uridine kinase